MKLYWVSAIVQNKEDKKPWLRATSNGTNFNEAMEIINRIKEHSTVLSIWIDTFDENNVKETVFHECYLNGIGQIRY